VCARIGLSPHQHDSSEQTVQVCCRLRGRNTRRSCYRSWRLVLVYQSHSLRPIHNILTRFQILPSPEKLNPSGNPPVCIDHAVRTIPLSKLKTTDQESLTREFCRGIWSGPGFPKELMPSHYHPNSNSRTGNIQSCGWKQVCASY